MKFSDVLFPPRGALLASLLALCALTVIAPSPIRADDAQRVQKWREMQVGPKPDWSWLPRLRVLTEADYPPFNYYDEEARLTGFNIDLARAICRELSVDCDINTAEWSTLVPSLKNNEADAVIASMAITGKALADVDFTSRYYTTPARFVGKAGSGFKEISVETLRGERIAVVRGSSHEAFLRDFFGRAKILPYDTAEQARVALKNGDADLLFGDGISLMFWIQGTSFKPVLRVQGRGLHRAALFRRRRGNCDQERERAPARGAGLCAGAREGIRPL